MQRATAIAMYDWDEEEEEGEEGSSWLEATGKNVILFLVDGTAPMQAGCLPIRRAGCLPIRRIFFRIGNFVL